jgi:hypothetical protein
MSKNGRMPSDGSGCTQHFFRSFRPSCSLVATTVVPHCVGPRTRLRTALEGYNSSAPGSSLGPGLWCPGPSSLSRPHPSHSSAHRDFTAWRLIRVAFAVRERVGDPRVVPGFCCSFLPDMPPSLTPGSSIIVSVQNRCRRWPSLWTKGFGTPENPAIRFTRGTDFGATLVRDCYGLLGCWPPYTDLTGLPANGGFTSSISTGRLSFPLLDMTYNSDWTPLLAGLSPAGMAASLAALVRPCVARGLLRVGACAVLHQCIRPLIGAFVLRAIMDSARLRSR